MEAHDGKSGRNSNEQTNEWVLVPALAHKHYTDMFAIIVRSNKSMVALNEDFIEEQLCRGESANYFKVYLTRIRENFCLF